jgi:hypothetical protein
MLLKRADCMVELFVEDVDCDVPPGAEVCVRALEVTERGQRSPDLGDRWTTVTTAQSIAVAAMRFRHPKPPVSRVSSPADLLTGLAVLSQTLDDLGKTPGKPPRSSAS